MAFAEEVGAKEKGYPAPPLPDVGHLTPGGSRWVNADFQRYITQINVYSRTHYWTHDEALRASGICNTDIMWNDPVMSSSVMDRIRPVVQLEWQLEPRNPTDHGQKELARVVSEIIDDIPDFQQLRRHLMMALWWGRSGVELALDWNYATGDKRVAVRDYQKIHGDSLVFKFDGTPGYLVNPGLIGQKNVIRIEGRGGAARFLDEEEEQVFLFHKFEPMPAEYFRPEAAGSIHGSGYRGRTYWFWWLKHNLMRITFDFLRKAGNGFFVAGYQAGNRDELIAMQNALASQEGSPIFFVPLDQSRSIDEVIKNIPVNLQGADFQWTVIQSLNSQIRSAILGEVATTGAMNTGLGSSLADQHGMTADERVKYDAVDLEAPLQKLVNLISRIIAPGVRPPRFHHLADKRQPQEIMACVEFAAKIGLAIPKIFVQEQLGIPEANEGEEVLGMVQAQQATALGATPAGVPMQGQPGPADQAGQGGQQAQQGQSDQGGQQEPSKQVMIDPNIAAQIQPMAG